MCCSNPSKVKSFASAIKILYPTQLTSLLNLRRFQDAIHFHYGHALIHFARLLLDALNSQSVFSNNSFIQIYVSILFQCRKAVWGALSFNLVPCLVHSWVLFELALVLSSLTSLTLLTALLNHLRLAYSLFWGASPSLKIHCLPN